LREENGIEPKSFWHCGHLSWSHHGRSLSTVAPFRGETVSVFSVGNRDSAGCFGKAVVRPFARINQKNQSGVTLSLCRYYFPVLVRIQVGPPTPFPRHSCNLTLFLPPLNSKGCAVSAVREVRDENPISMFGLVALLLVGCQPMTSDVKSTDTCLVSAPTTIG
jgi:hypothetical protein